MALKSIYRELSSARPSARGSSTRANNARRSARPRRSSRQSTPSGFGDLLAQLFGASATLERARRRR